MMRTPTPFLPLLLARLCLVLVPVAAPATVYHVPGDAATLQGGIDLAPSGDTVLVADGTYSGTGNYDLDCGGKDLVIRSVNGAGTTIINCNGQGRAFDYHMNETGVLEGFTIIFGFAPSDYGAALLIRGDCSPVIVDCVLKNNFGTWGGAVAVRGTGEPVFLRCVFTGNSASQGGAIWTDNSYRGPELYSCTVASNEAGVGGGLHVEGAADLELRNTIVWGSCAVTGDQLSVGSAGAAVSFTCCDVDSSGIASIGTVDFVSDNIFVDPIFAGPELCTEAPTSAGDYRPIPGSPCAPWASPCGQLIGAVDPVPSDGVHHVPSEFLHIQWAMIHAAPGDTVLIAPGTYTGPYDRDLDFGGKAMVVTSKEGPASTIIDCERSGRGFYFGTGEGRGSVVQGLTIRNGAAHDGGGIYMTGASPTIHHVVFEGDSAHSGGGLYGTDYSSPELVHCAFLSNTAGNRGGGLYLFRGNPLIDSCFFVANRANDGAGGAFTDMNPLIRNCTFSGNIADWRGGGFSCRETEIFFGFQRCTFYDNSAPAGGAGWFDVTSYGTLENCIVAFSPSGESILIDPYATVAVGCTDIFGNAGGDWVGDLAAMEGLYGNLTVDPLFCFPGGDTVGLQLASPCADDPTCGLMGARHATCDNERIRRVPLEYATIQSALDASEEGDTVLVAPGTYAGAGNVNIDFGGRGVKLISEAGPESTVIDCEGTARGFYFHGGEPPAAGVEGFTVTGAYNSSLGGAVYITSGSPVFRNCILINGGSARGAGVYSTGASSDPLFRSCTVAANDATLNGGGIRCYGGSLTLERCIVWGNTGPEDGEAAVASGASVDFICCDIDTASVGGDGTIDYDAHTFAADPYFCSENYCDSPELLPPGVRLAANSPCLPGASPCDSLVGALGEGCGDLVVWTGDGDGVSWEDPLNWSTGSLPGADDDVRIVACEVDDSSLRMSGAAGKSLSAEREGRKDPEAAETGFPDGASMRDGIIRVDGKAADVILASAAVIGSLVVGETVELDVNGDDSEMNAAEALINGKVSITSGEWEDDGDLFIGGGGTLALTDGLVRGAGTVRNLGTTSMSGASALTADFENLYDAGLAMQGEFQVLGGTGSVRNASSEGLVEIAAGALFRVEDLFVNQAAGSVDLQGSLQGGGAPSCFRNFGAFRKSGTGVSTVDVEFRNNDGAFDVDEGTLRVFDLFDNRSSFTVAAGAQLDLQGEFSNAKGAFLTVDGSETGSGTIDNYGTFGRNAAGTGSVSSWVNNLADPSTGSKGKIEVEGGTLTLAHLTSEGIARIAPGATLAITGHMTNAVNAEIGGAGTFDFSAGSFTNSGVLKPGDSPGTLTIVGDLVQQPSAEIRLELGGNDPETDYDRLLVDGTAVLGGSVHVSYTNGFTPALDDTFAVIGFTGAGGVRGFAGRGDFDCYSGIERTGGIYLDPVQLPTAFLFVATVSETLNAPPAALGDSDTTTWAAPVTVAPLENDSDPDLDDLRIVAVSAAMTAGTVYIDDGDTTLTYAPPVPFVGPDTFAYHVTDCVGGIDSALVVIHVGDATGLPEAPLPPARHHLYPNVPNPFNPTTLIRYDLSAAGRVTVEIYDVRGRRVRVLTDRRLEAGSYTRIWRGDDEAGREVASGVYFVLMQTESFCESRKMVLVR